MQLRADAVGRGGEEPAVVERVQAREFAEARRRRSTRRRRAAARRRRPRSRARRLRFVCLRLVGHRLESTIRLRWTPRRSMFGRSRAASSRLRSSLARSARRCWRAPERAAMPTSSRMSTCSSMSTRRRPTTGSSCCARRSAARTSCRSPPPHLVQFDVGGVAVQVGYTTVAELEEQLDQLLVRLEDVHGPMQKLLSGLVEGRPLHGEELLVAGASAQRRIRTSCGERASSTTGSSFRCGGTTSRSRRATRSSGGSTCCSRRRSISSASLLR